MLSLLLVGVVLGLAGGLAREYAELSRFSQNADLYLEAENGLERVRAEVRQSVRMLSPATGSSAWASRLAFEKISDANRLTSPPQVPGSVWEFYPSSSLVIVEFLNEARGLVRSVTRAGVTSQSVLVTRTEGFSCRYLKNDRTLEMSLTLNDGRRRHNLVGLVERPVTR